MSRLIRILILILSIYTAPASFAQIVQDPTKWSYEAKKINGNEYQIIFHLE